MLINKCIGILKVALILYNSMLKTSIIFYYNLNILKTIIKKIIF